MFGCDPGASFASCTNSPYASKPHSAAALSSRPPYRSRSSA